MALPNGGYVKTFQKLRGIVPAQAYPQGSTIRVFPMPSFQVSDPDNAVVQNVWWRVVSGVLGQNIGVYADVTGPNEVTVVVNNPGASINVSLEIGGTVIEYA